MTATTPENGLRTRLQRLARGTVISAIVLGMCGLGATNAVAASDSDTDETPAAELFVSAGVRGTVSPGSATTASLTVQNDATSQLSAGRVTVELNRTPLTDEAAVTTWLEDAEATGAFDQLGADTTAPVEPESSVTSSLFIPPETLGALAPGVYALRATLTGAQPDGQDASEAVTSTSVLVVSAAANPPVAVMVPITATPVDGALLTAEELTALTAQDGSLTAVLEGVRGTSAILAIDPAIVASIKVLGSAAPQSAQEWLQQLDALPNERFALQFGDADATTQSQAGLPQLLQPTTLTPFLTPANFTSPPEETPSPTPTPTETPSEEPDPADGPVLPDDAELTAVEGATPGTLWPRSDVSATDLATFAAYLPDGAVTVLSSTTVSGAVGARATVGAQNVLVSDAATSDALSDAANEEDPALRQRSLAEASAHLYLSGQASPGTPRLVGLDRDETRTAEALNDAIAAVDSLGFGLTSVLAAAPTAVTLTAEADVTRATSLQRMLDSEVVLGEFATILDDRQLLLSPKRIQIMRATAVGLSEDRFDEAVAAVNTATTDTLASVDIPPASTIQLLSANADLPFSVRNDLPWPVNIELSVKPSDPRLDVQSVTPWTIQPGTTTRVKVPVSARVGSGEVTLALQLSSPTGVPISQPETVRVSVRAEWEAIGLGVLGALIVLLLGLGIIRTVRRRRREALAQDAPEPDADADAVAVEESNE
ncbi:hypothetical protein JOF42_000530 [Microbacterium phyllosphaerae]|uniref:Uncharacterized protein n=1 Tax=Microbacterium phyllosphaerae TaxID=124798 RepID=A0ABS4WLF8_9MICO|nr:DUF6049 family protein [Microbacterium phyllosphaerae]MBP2377035.1 hypothetical protein [Microbacterium phyllosphaerae]